MLFVQITHSSLACLGLVTMFACLARLVQVDFAWSPILCVLPRADSAQSTLTCLVDSANPFLSLSYPFFIFIFSILLLAISYYLFVFSYLFIYSLVYSFIYYLLSLFLFCHLFSYLFIVIHVKMHIYLFIYHNLWLLHVFVYSLFTYSYSYSVVFYLLVCFFIIIPL